MNKKVWYTKRRMTLSFVTGKVQVLRLEVNIAAVEHS